MFHKIGLCVFALTMSAFVFVFTLASRAEANGQESQSHSLITHRIDESKLVTLTGNTRPEANSRNDRGPVPDNLSMEHMLLQLQHSPEQEAALNQTIEQLHNPASPSFHKWLTPQQFAARFGVSNRDAEVVSGWLKSHGFTVNVMYPLAIDFSGTAGEVREAFGTEIHSLEVNGQPHIANMSDPKIPAALAPVVVGVVSLHDFLPHPMHTGLTRVNFNPSGSLVARQLKSQFTFTEDGETAQAVVPADLATIYNFNPTFNAGISGQGQTIVVIEDTNLFSTSDWTTFRSTFGLSTAFPSGSFTTVHPAPPSGTNNCTNPGVVVGNDFEATLDAEYASAAAPSATIELASCEDTTTFGGLIAVENLLNESSTPPAVISISYGECEPGLGATGNTAYNTTYSQAVTEGVSVFVSSGDEGAASCDADQTHATHGITVNGFGSTPNNVSVGGTDFGDTFAGTNADFWSTTNSATFGSAESYINEIPWNDSCASSLIAKIEGSASGLAFCNTTTGREDFETTASGSGGPSNCATGAASTSGVASGTCKGWAKPSYQSIVGNPSDGVRDLPDVSLFASNGVWGHFYIICYSDTSGGGVACTGSPSGWTGAGGTSFATPIWAGIQALVNQKAGGRQGNPNFVYYQLASSEYGANGSSTCNSSNAASVGSSCTFYDVTQGDMDVPCTGSHNCDIPSRDRLGVLSTSNTADDPAYGTTTGWDFATGIGTVNVTNLVNNFTTVTNPSPKVK
jgi:subtilase family serine protease